MFETWKLRDNPERSFARGRIVPFDCRGRVKEEPTAPRRWRSPPETWAKLRDSAKAFRASPTPGEKRLWNALRSRQVAGLRFRRQHAVDRYLIDFYCSEARLAVEVDGPIHEEQAEQDLVRQQYLEQLGIRVLRVTNDEVMRNLGEVLFRIQKAASQEYLPLSEIGEGD